MNLSELIPILVLNRLNPVLTEVLQSLDVVFDVQEFAYKDYLLTQVTEWGYYSEKVATPLLEIESQGLSDWVDRVSPVPDSPMQVEEEVTIKFALLDLIRRKQKICQDLLDNMLSTDANDKAEDASVVTDAEGKAVSVVHSDVFSKMNDKKTQKEKFDFSLPPEKNLERIFGRLNRKIFFEESSSKGTHKVIFRDQNRRVLMTYQGNYKERATLVMLMTLDKLLKINHTTLKKYYHDLDEDIRKHCRVRRPVQAKAIAGNFVPYGKSPKAPCTPRESKTIANEKPVQAKASVFDKLARIVQCITERISRTTPLIGEQRLKILKLARREGFFAEFSPSKIKHHLPEMRHFEKIVLFFEVLSKIFSGCSRDLGRAMKFTFTNFFDQQHGRVPPVVTEERYSTKIRISDGRHSRQFIYDTTDPDCILMSKSLFTVQFVTEREDIGHYIAKYKRYLRADENEPVKMANASKVVPSGEMVNLNFLAPAVVQPSQMFSTTFYTKLDPSNIVFSISPEGIGEAFHLELLEDVGPPRLGEKANVLGNIKVQNLINSINIFQSTLIAPFKLNCLA